MRKTKVVKVNYAVPGEPMTPDEMQQMVHEAENGKFHRMRAVKRKIELWKQKYEK